jgi:hypothetical protein
VAAVVVGDDGDDPDYARCQTLPEKNPSSKKRKAALAAASANLFNVKLAWRNPVMHPKESYSPEEAVEVYDMTKRFMSHLASVLWRHEGQTGIR